MKIETIINPDGKAIAILFDDLQVDLLEVIDCYDKVYSCTGIGSDGKEYTGSAIYSCDELQGIEDIEEL